MTTTTKFAVELDPYHIGVVTGLCLKALTKETSPRMEKAYNEILAAIEPHAEKMYKQAHVEGVLDGLPAQV